MANILQLYADVLHLHGLYLHLQSSENQLYSCALHFSKLQSNGNQAGAPVGWSRNRDLVVKSRLPAHRHCLFDE